ncbi:MAG: hypothetical protein J6N55_07325 [Anaerovibrio sp.]|uniref:hypothetical protein n=1 Tax=Anaerovibrio sp. TaxID=1872532 RepID=UPI001B0D3860|nr:hypothetical protein [Anaerovibrio sp.]MBO6246075.1 hypothetical protein [Anaerovibrio sp.]
MVKKLDSRSSPFNTFLNMEYRRKSPCEALFFPGKAAEIQIKGYITLFPRPESGADFSRYTGNADVCTTDDFMIVDI